MKAPSEFQLDQMVHFYDPAYAREYYLRTRKLKGRQPGRGDDSSGSRSATGSDPRTGKTRQQIAKDARTKQRKELATRISNLEGKLKKLEAKIAEKERKEASEDRKGKAKKERARKENEKPKTAAEKAKAARENEKYRDKNQQKLKSDAKKDGKSGGGSSKSKGSKSVSVSDLKVLAKKVRGQIAVAKQKLAAL